MVILNAGSGGFEHTVRVSRKQVMTVVPCQKIMHVGLARPRLRRRAENLHLHAVGLEHCHAPV